MMHGCMNVKVNIKSLEAKSKLYYLTFKNPASHI